MVKESPWPWDIGIYLELESFIELRGSTRSHALYGLVLIWNKLSLCFVWWVIIQDSSLLYYDFDYPWHNNCRATPSRAWWSLHWRCWCRWSGAPGWAPSPPGLSWRLSSCCADTGLMLWCWDQYPESDDAGRWASWDHLVLVSTWCWSLDVSRVMRWRDTETETVCGVGAGGGLAIHCRRVARVPRPPPIILHTDPGADHTQCVPDFHDTLGNHLNLISLLRYYGDWGRKYYFVFLIYFIFFPI